MIADDFSEIYLLDTCWPFVCLSAIAKRVQAQDLAEGFNSTNSHWRTVHCDLCEKDLHRNKNAMDKTEHNGDNNRQDNLMLTFVRACFLWYLELYLRRPCCTPYFRTSCPWTVVVLYHCYYDECCWAIWCWHTDGDYNLLR